jgi:hypothetical protein
MQQDGFFQLWSQNEQCEKTDSRTEKLNYQGEIRLKKDEIAKEDVAVHT